MKEIKALIHIETYTVAAYRAIRPAVVAYNNIGYYGASGLLISATINPEYYSFLVDVINQAAKESHVPREEYSIILMQMFKV